MADRKSDLSVEDMIDPAKSPYLSCDLPTGLLDENGEIHKTCLIREMTGNEEDLIASKSILVALQAILEGCVVSIGNITQKHPKWKEHIGKLCYADRFFLVIRIRAASLGRDFSFMTRCPHCAKTSNQTVDLYDFKIEGLKDPINREWEGKLPSGKPYKAKISTYEDEQKAQRENVDDLLTRELYMRMVSIDSKPVSVNTLKNLSLKDRRYLRADVRAHEGVIDDTVEMVCPHCKGEFRGEIRIADSNFFFPSET